MEEEEIPVILKPNIGFVVLCFLVNAIMGPFFAVYAWNNPDGDFECFSWEDSYAAIKNPVGITEAKDVSFRFASWFVWGFALACTGVLYSIMAIAYIATDALILLQVANSLITLCLVGNLGWTVCGTVFRYKHYGKVCSGDYFDWELYGEVDPFLWKSGQFMYIYLLLLWAFWTFAILFGGLGTVLSAVTGKN